MGCGGSKPKKCRQCKREYSPSTRSFSMNVHHPPISKGDSYHIVALTSSTLGSIKLDSPSMILIGKDSKCIDNDDKFMNHSNGTCEKQDIYIDMYEAKAWSQMIDHKIPMVGSNKYRPKTPITTPPGEPESIDVDDLMKGLECYSPFQTQENNLNGDKIVEKMVDVVVPNNGYDQVKGFVGRLNDGVDKIVAHNEDKLSSKKERVILYFTSLRGVRKTYEDCCYIKLILKGYRVRVDERDVSMHSDFKQELKERLGAVFKGGLPKVFVGERYIGGVEEMRQLHEDGELEKVFKDCESFETDSGNLVDACEACGDIRFVPCDTCSGSCKIYYECEDNDEEYEEDGCGFQRCPDCNENGLVRCPFCCD